MEDSGLFEVRVQGGEHQVMHGMEANALWSITPHELVLLQNWSAWATQNGIWYQTDGEKGEEPTGLQ